MFNMEFKKYRNPFLISIEEIKICGFVSRFHYLIEDDLKEN